MLRVIGGSQGGGAFYGRGSSVKSSRSTFRNKVVAVSLLHSHILAFSHTPFMSLACSFSHTHSLTLTLSLSLSHSPCLSLHLSQSHSLPLPSPERKKKMKAQGATAHVLSTGTQRDLYWYRNARHACMTTEAMSAHVLSFRSFNFIELPTKADTGTGFVKRPCFLSGHTRPPCTLLHSETFTDTKRGHVGIIST